MPQNENVDFRQFLTELFGNVEINSTENILGKNYKLMQEQAQTIKQQEEAIITLKKRNQELFDANQGLYKNCRELNDALATITCGENSLSESVEEEEKEGIDDFVDYIEERFADLEAKFNRLATAYNDHLSNIHDAHTFTKKRRS